MRFSSTALVAAALLVFLTACGKKAEDESAATQPAEQPTRTAEAAPGTTTNFEDQSAPQEQPKSE